MIRCTNLENISYSTDEYGCTWSFKIQKMGPQSYLFLEEKGKTTSDPNFFFRSTAAGRKHRKARRGAG